MSEGPRAPGAASSAAAAEGAAQQARAEELAEALVGAARLPATLPSSGGLRLLAVEARAGSFVLVLGREAPSARIVLTRAARGVEAVVEGGGARDAAALGRAAERLARLSPRRWEAAQRAAARGDEGRGERLRDRVDVERAALVARLKPAIRLSLTPGDAAAAAARLEAAGAHVVRGRGFIGSERKVRVLVYASLDARRAAELWDVEGPTVAETPTISPAETTARVRRTGELLGYPPCCVDAFLRLLREEIAAARSAAPHVADAYRAARSAWVARPDPLLNTLLRAAGLQLVSHEPCRFDCAPSAAYARACLAEAARLDAGAARALERGLAVAVVISPAGARAIASPAAGPPPRIASARPHAGSADPSDRALAASLAGREIGRDGAVEGIGAPAPLLVDFRAR